MRRESHVRIWEGGGVRFPSATRRNIYVRSETAGQRVMASVTRFIETRLQAPGQRGEERCGRPRERKFLGFTITNDRERGGASRRRRSKRSRRGCGN